MTARDEILAAISRLDQDVFSPADVVREMQRHGTAYSQSTIRTHVTSRMCADAPDNHGTTYADLERVGHGRYRLRPGAGRR